MKKLAIIIAFIGFWFDPAPAQESDSAGILRIQIDINNVTLAINGENVILDSYGNRLIKQSSFILSLSPGNYDLVFLAKDYEPIDTTVTIVMNKSLPLNIQFIADEIASESIINEVNVNISSQPDSINILLKNNPDTLTTPVSLSLLPGTLSFNAFRKGFESMAANYELGDNDNISLEFLLKTSKPAKITAFDLGLEFRPIIPERNKAEADVIRSRFNSLAEMFTIFPLSQGIMAKLILDSENDSDADILIISGAVLSIGSLILGKSLHKKRIKAIRKFNRLIKVDNQLAKEFNSDINKTVRTQNAENLKQWKLENTNKGIIRTINE